MEATIESNIDDAEMPIKNCVEIRGARKRYSPELVILNGLNMTVQKGTMYVMFAIYSYKIKIIGEGRC